VLTPRRLPRSRTASPLPDRLPAAQDATAGAELPRFGQVSERLFRGAQPRPGGIARLAALGIDTVVNLRGAGVRVGESKVFRARKLGRRALRRAPGAVGGFLGAIF